MKPKIMMTTSSLTPDELQYLQDLHKNPMFYNYDYLTLQILYTRGIKTAEEMYLFLNGTIKDLTPCQDMKDSMKFCEIVKDEIINNKHIVIYTDYDMDGIGAGGVGTLGLRNYARLMNSSSQIDWYANSRFVEGYGITKNGVNDLVSKFPDVDLIITTDNGIVGYDGVNRCKELGIKIIVTDHHQEGETIVNADAIIDPHQKDDNSSFKDLCGAGVIWKLLYMLFYIEGFDEEEVCQYLDIVALSTVADLVPLVGDNRLIVKEGLKRAASESNPMFRVLREVFNEMQLKESAKITIIDEETFGFNYGPAFNSLGRLDGVIDKAMELIFSKDETKMRNLAKEIYETNIQRKILTNTANERTYNELILKYPTEDLYPPLFIIRDDSIEEGIIGLVASYIKETFNRPTIVFTKAKKTIEENGVQKVVECLKGSARSIDGFDITKSFRTTKSTSMSFGGHEAAAGINVAIDKFDDFIQAECNYAKKVITSDMYIPKIYVDAAFKVEEMTEDNIEILSQAKPYGMKFPKPKIGISNFIVTKNNYKIPEWESVFCGEDKQTVRLVSQNKNFVALMFKHRQQFESILTKYPSVDYLNEIPVKIIGNPSMEYNSFFNCYRPKFVVENYYVFG